MNRANSSRRIGIRLFLLGGALAVIVGLVVDMQAVISSERANRRPEHCAGTINADATISREQLATFLTVAERGAKATVQDILLIPYCELPELEIRAGIPAERAVYRLAFDPQTWLVVLYEGEEYAGYQFQIMQ